MQTETNEEIYHDPNDFAVYQLIDIDNIKTIYELNHIIACLLNRFYKSDEKISGQELFDFLSDKIPFKPFINTLIDNGQLQPFQLFNMLNSGYDNLNKERFILLFDFFHKKLGIKIPYLDDVDFENGLVLSNSIKCTYSGNKDSYKFWWELFHRIMDNKMNNNASIWKKDINTIQYSVDFRDVSTFLYWLKPYNFLPMPKSLLMYVAKLHPIPLYENVGQILEYTFKSNQSYYVDLVNHCNKPNWRFRNNQLDDKICHKYVFSWLEGAIEDKEIKIFWRRM
jgi:hypothetical protein